MLPAHGTRCPSALCALLSVESPRFVHASTLYRADRVELCPSALGRPVLVGAEALQGWMSQSVRHREPDGDAQLEKICGKESADHRQICSLVGLFIWAHVSKGTRSAGMTLASGALLQPSMRCREYLGDQSDGYLGHSERGLAFVSIIHHDRLLKSSLCVVILLPA